MAKLDFTVSSATIGNVSNTELNYLDGVSSAIQTQLNQKPSAPTLLSLTGSGTLSSSSSYSQYIAIVNSSSAATVSLPNPSSQTSGTKYTIVQDGTGQVTISAEGSLGFGSVQTYQMTNQSASHITPAYYNGTWLIADGTKILSSTNGTSWTQRYNHLYNINAIVGAKLANSGGGSAVGFLAYSDGAVIYSTDGITWGTDYYLTISGQNPPFDGYIFSEFGYFWYMESSSTGTYRVFRSSNPANTTWAGWDTATELPSYSSSPYDRTAKIATNSEWPTNDKSVLLLNGKIYYTNGTGIGIMGTWTDTGISFVDQNATVQYQNGYFIVRLTSMLYYSTDGITWTLSATPPTSSYGKVYYNSANSKYLMVDSLYLQTASTIGGSWSGYGSGAISGTKSITGSQTFADPASSIIVGPYTDSGTKGYIYLSSLQSITPPIYSVNSNKKISARYGVVDVVCANNAWYLSGNLSA